MLRLELNSLFIIQKISHRDIYNISEIFWESLKSIFQLGLVYNLSSFYAKKAYNLAFKSRRIPYN